MSNYLASHTANRKVTPQNEPIPGTAQVENSAGGFSFEVNDWTRLERFLILGSEGGSYYATERDLTKENIAGVLRCIENDGPQVVRMVVDISWNARAPKNDQAVYVLALAASAKAPATREAALAAVPKVCRIGTHLFQFVQVVDTQRGWGRQLRKAIANWYRYNGVGNRRTANELAHQVLKYQQRGGWSHRDVLRLAHPTPDSIGAEVFKYVVKGEVEPKAPSIIAAYEEAKNANETRVVELVREHGLTREMVPTKHQKSPAVWETLLEKMPITAMVRTLGRMGACGLLKPLSNASAIIVDRLRNEEAIHKSRIHPIQMLTAMLTYKSGHGQKGNLSWPVVPQIVDALDNAFYLAFQNVPATGKRFYLALDVSGSMSWKNIAGVQGLTPRVGSAAMAMVTARSEAQYYIAGFSHTMVQIPISVRNRLDEAIAIIQRLPMGGTDCALPMLDALEQKIPVDCFVVYTDSETWAGKIHPVQALRQYRERMGIPARLVVVGMVSNQFSIADPSDAGMLDVVGFDAATPAVIGQFVGGQSQQGEEE